MKIDRHGRAKILTQYEIQLLFNTLDELYKYLEVKQEQVKGASASLSMLTPVSSSESKSYFGKSVYPQAESKDAHQEIEAD